MTIEFRCGQCNQLLRVPDNSAGKNARCPKCQALMQVPSSSPAPLPGPFGAASVASPPPLPPLPGPSTAPPFVSPPPPPPKGDDPFAFLGGAAPAKPTPPANPFGDSGLGGAPPAPPQFGSPPAPFGAPSVNPYASPGGGYAGGYAGGVANYGPRSGLPWEVKRQSFGSWWETMMMIVSTPSLAFTRMRQYGGLGSPIMFAIWGLGMPVALLMCLLIPFAILIAVGAGNEGGAGMGLGIGVGMIFGFAVALIFYVFVAATLGALIAAAIYHVCLLMVGGARQGFETTFRVVSFVQGGIAPVGVLLGLIPYLGGLLHLIWMIVLLIIGLAKAHEIPTGKAALAVLLPFGVMMLLCMGLVALSILGAAAGN
jgi:phage FluMu protein Com